MIRLTLSFTDLIEVSSFTEKFQYFSAAVARIHALRDHPENTSALFRGRRLPDADI